MSAELVKPYDPEAGKKAQVEQMFDRIAPKYDFLNRLLSGGIDIWWRRRAISYLKKDKPRQILDVATGTADLALETFRQIVPEKIIGIDIANEMLEFGREKIKKAGLSDKISLETGDSENLRFADNSFDAVTVSFGVRNFENLEKGLSEMCRVLSPGGQVVILEFSQPQSFPIKQLYGAYFRYVLPLIGRVTSRDPRAYTYLFESVQAFPQGDDFCKILTKTGFHSPTHKRLSLGICSVYLARK